MEGILLMEYYPLVFDIINKYRTEREQGNSSDKAREIICENYKQELIDDDEQRIVWISIALAQATELGKDDPIKQKALQAIAASLDNTELSEGEITAFLQSAKLLQAPALPPERKKPERKPYLPNWQVGDTFTHILSHPLAYRAGLIGWYVIFRKTGEYLDINYRTHQLGYISLCPPEKLPHTDKELEELGYLRIMGGSKSWEYAVQIDIQSKKAEKNLQFEYLGQFPNVPAPQDEIIRKPEVSMPLFGGIDKTTGCPRFEDSICLIYERNGTTRTD